MERKINFFFAVILSRKMLKCKKEINNKLKCEKEKKNRFFSYYDKDTHIYTKI